MSGFWTERRWGAGSLLLIATLFLLLWPLWHTRNITHPMAGADQPDLCSKLPPAPATFADTKLDASKTNMCAWRDANGYLIMIVGLLNSHSGFDTERQYQSMTQDIHKLYLSGDELPAQKDGWRHAYAWKAATDKRGFLFEDHGIIVQFEAQRLDAAAMQRYAEDVQQTLRPPEK